MNEVKYKVECLGDLRDTAVFDTQEEALKYLKENYGYTDPEDNRMLIWEVLPSGHQKVVWHFSGWHWDNDEFGLPQGHYLGEEKSVYEMSMQDE